jgi:tRNA A-37 threonylcarbamoyl transferase component Bud32
MHIFEYLGREVPEEKWDNRKVRAIIKSSLEELHLLGISHNDVRPANIHVSVSGKISLIDFGLSDCTNNEEHKKNDFETLDSILGVYGSNENDPQGIQYGQENEVLPDEAGNDENDGSGSNPSSEAVLMR